MFKFLKLSVYREMKEQLDAFKDQAAKDNDWNLNEPVVDFRNWKTMFPQEVGSDLSFDTSAFNKWYNIYRRPQHEAWIIKRLTKYPHLLSLVLRGLCEFDFKGVQEYMQETNWKYGSGNEESVPDVSKLINTVITLIGNPENGVNTISSGGFKVTSGIDEAGDPVFEIEFETQTMLIKNFKL